MVFNSRLSIFYNHLTSSIFSILYFVFSFIAFLFFRNLNLFYYHTYVFLILYLRKLYNFFRLYYLYYTDCNYSHFILFMLFLSSAVYATILPNIFLFFFLDIIYHNTLYYLSYRYICTLFYYFNLFSCF